MTTDRHSIPGAAGKQRRNVIWAIGGGKGGIGKSFITSNLAICIARMGYSVTLIDLDLGSANLHTCLGIQPPPTSLTDFIVGRAHSLEEITTASQIPHLNFIGGLNDALNIADLEAQHRVRLLSGIHDVPTQFVLLDLGAGTSENTLDFFLSADQQIVAIVPEPTSVENAYRFVKAAYYRKFQQAESLLGIKDVIAAAMDQKNQLGIKTPSDLVRTITRQNPAAGQQLVSILKSFHLRLLLNQARTHQDIEIGYGMKSLCRKYFGIETEFLGHLDYDNAAWQALRRKRPLTIEFPSSSLAAQLYKITKNLVRAHSIRAAG